MVRLPPTSRASAAPPTQPRKSARPSRSFRCPTESKIYDSWFLSSGIFRLASNSILTSSIVKGIAKYLTFRPRLANSRTQSAVGSNADVTIIGYVAFRSSRRRPISSPLSIGIASAMIRRSGSVRDNSCQASSPLFLNRRKVASLNQSRITNSKDWNGAGSLHTIMNLSGRDFRG